MSMLRTILRYQAYFKSEAGKRESLKAVEEARSKGLTMTEYFQHIKDKVHNKLKENKREHI